MQKLHDNCIQFMCRVHIFYLLFCSIFFVRKAYWIAVYVSTFPCSFYPLPLMQNSPIVQVKAFDGDAGIGNEISYEIVKGKLGNVKCYIVAPSL